jgi:CheY-like chemotaxis protein
VEDLLDVSRIASGKFQMRFEVVDLCEVVSSAIDVLAPQAAAKSIRIASTIPDTPCLVSGDSDRLQQAVMNVLSNAIKFSQEGLVTVDVSNMRGTGEYVIGVQDSGVGIAPDFLPKVFERFRQADDSITRQRSGLGLGLSIVKEVVEHHGGSVLASSAGIGRGARFTIRLPQLIEAEAIPRSTRARASSQGPLEPLQGLRVLVVDDDPDALEIAATALATAGATVGVALSGREAITTWREGSFDALVCDLAMPDIDGFQVLDRIADFERHSGQGPIAVALTAYASKEYQHRSLAAGFHIHLPKPYNTRDLVSALAEAMEKSPAQRVPGRRTHAEFH